MHLPLQTNSPELFMFAAGSIFCAELDVDNLHSEISRQVFA